MKSTIAIFRGSAASAALILVPAVAQAQASPSAYTWGIRYDAMGRVTGTIAPDPDGAGPLKYAATRNTYDSYGRLIRVEKGELASWQSDTIAASAWTAFTVFSSLESSYDSMGRKTFDTAKGLNGATYSVMQYSYDSYDRLECAAQRMNPATWSSPLGSSCTLGTIGSYGSDRITKKTYDNLDRITKVQKAYGTSIQGDEAAYTYLGNTSEIATLTDARGYKASMSYDGFGRKWRWYFPNPTTLGIASTTDYEEYGYDAAGNRTSFRKRDGSTLTYSYDALNRTTVKIVPSRTGLTAAQTRDVYYTYDLTNRQLTAKFDSASGSDGVTNAYNGFGELLTSRLKMGTLDNTLYSSYDIAGRRTQLKHPENTSTYTFSYCYDALSRLTNLGQGTSCTATPLHTFAYGSNGLLSSRSEGAGSSVGYTWDDAGRLASQTDDFTGTAASVGWTFSHNPASQIITETRDNDSYAWTGAVAVDRNYAVNGLNQYTSAGPASFTYDANGNLTSDGSNSYVYDIENRLATATSGSYTTTLTYDPLGRLFQVVRKLSTYTMSDTRFVHDGDAMVLEFNSSGAVTNRFVHGSNAAADDPLVWYAGANLTNKKWLHANHLGSIVAATDSSGGSPAINTYDEYGIPGSGNTGRFQYTGQAWLPELGTYHYKARIYSPTLGRFLQTDPIGYDDQINLYAYVANDPVNKNDPTGTYGCGKSIISTGKCEQFQQYQNAQIDRLSKALSKIESVKFKMDNNGKLTRHDRRVLGQVGKYLGKDMMSSKGLAAVLKIGNASLSDLRSSSKSADISSTRTDHMTAKAGGAGIWINPRVFATNRGWGSLPHEGIHTGTRGLIGDVHWGGYHGAYDDAMKVRAARTRPDQARRNADSWTSAILGDDE